MSRIITALDVNNASSALEFAEKINPSLTHLKVGKELFTREGPSVVRDLHNLGFQIFLDLKFHDIPNTVAGAISAAADLGVWMVNVHASGGERMMEAAVKANNDAGGETLLIAVTVLTSMNDEEVASVGFRLPATGQAQHLARLAHSAGLDGVVCSPQEVPVIKSACKGFSGNSGNSNSAGSAYSGSRFLTVTPGVRPSPLNTSDDQRRTMTPIQAMENGSDYLVIGRPITQAKDADAALKAITDDIDKRTMTGTQANA